VKRPRWIGPRRSNNAGPIRYGSCRFGAQPSSNPRDDRASGTGSCSNPSIPPPANTVIPYRLIYAEGGAPDWLNSAPRERAAKSEIEFVDFDEALWPNQIRKRIAPMIDTDYAVFLDNDMEVTPGWLEKLIACADEKGDGIICPLSCIGLDGEAFRKTHRAGGNLDEITESRGRVRVETHLRTDETLNTAAPPSPRTLRFR
jgi:hypothetical protein